MIAYPAINPTGNEIKFTGFTESTKEFTMAVLLSKKLALIQTLNTFVIGRYSVIIKELKRKSIMILISAVCSTLLANRLNTLLD